MRSQKELSLDAKILKAVKRFGLAGRAEEALALGDDGEPKRYL
jgi:hypothetical protein